MSGKEEHDGNRQQRLSNLPTPVVAPNIPLTGPVKSPSSDPSIFDPRDRYLSEQIAEKGNPVDPAFSVYTTRQKWLIITMAGFAGLFRSVFLIFHEYHIFTHTWHQVL